MSDEAVDGLTHEVLAELHNRRLVSVNNSLRMDRRLLNELKWLSNAVDDDFDGFILIDGEIEGCGKSLLGMQVCVSRDKKFTAKQIAYDLIDVARILQWIPKKRALLFDESGADTESAGVLSKKNRAFKRIMEKCRQKNLFVVLVRPSFFDWSKYYAIHRSWALLTVKLVPDREKKRFVRGFFDFYGRKRKKNLYLLGKKFMDRSVVRPNFRGMFSDDLPIPKKDYLERKKADFDDDIEKLLKDLSGDKPLNEEKFLGGERDASGDDKQEIAGADASGGEDKGSSVAGWLSF